MQFQIICGHEGLSPKLREWLLVFTSFLHFQSFRNENIYLLKYPMPCCFKIYMVKRVNLQNPMTRPCFLFFFFFFVSCTFRREAPFRDEKYCLKYLLSCSIRIYVAMWVYLQNPRSGCFFCIFSRTFRREAPFGNEI